MLCGLRIGAGICAPCIALAAIVAGPAEARDSARGGLEDVCNNFGVGPDLQIEACNYLLGMAGSSYTVVRAAAHLNRGVAYARKGNSRRSEGDFQEAIELETLGISRGGETLGYWYGARCWTRAIANAGLDAALADCDEAARLGNTTALASRGVVHLRRRDDALAYLDFKKRLEENPKSARAWFGQGIARLRLGDQVGARDDLFAAERLQPGIHVEFEMYGMTK